MIPRAGTGASPHPGRRRRKKRLRYPRLTAHGRRCGSAAQGGQPTRRSSRRHAGRVHVRLVFITRTCQEALGGSGCDGRVVLYFLPNQEVGVVPSYVGICNGEPGAAEASHAIELLPAAPHYGG